MTLHLDAEAVAPFLTWSGVIDALVDGHALGLAQVVNGTASLFSDTTGEVDATIDFHLLTKWKTAADSALAASRLARPDSERIPVVGSGTVAASMVDAYRAVFPHANVTIWSRTAANAIRLAEATGASATDDLVGAVGAADVICTATMAQRPVHAAPWTSATSTHPCPTGSSRRASSSISVVWRTERSHEPPTTRSPSARTPVGRTST